MATLSVGAIMYHHGIQRVWYCLLPLRVFNITVNVQQHRTVHALSIIQKQMISQIMQCMQSLNGQYLASSLCLWVQLIPLEADQEHLWRTHNRYKPRRLHLLLAFIAEIAVVPRQYLWFHVIGDQLFRRYHSL